MAALCWVALAWAVWTALLSVYPSLPEAAVAVSKIEVLIASMVAWGSLPLKLRLQAILRPIVTRIPSAIRNL